MTKNLKKLWQHRDLSIELFKTFLKLRHAGSVLGILWTLLNPAIYIMTYYVVFTYFINMGIPNYHLFLIPGFLAWNFSFNSLISSGESILQSKYLITKIAFPNEILTITNIALMLFDFVISLAIYMVAIVIFPGGFHFTYLILYVPLLIILQFLFTLGIGFIISSASVYFKDVPKIVQLSGTILFFLTPIFYSMDRVPEKFQRFLNLNPMSHIIKLYHNVLYYNTAPSPESILLITAISIFTCLGGYWIFNHYKKFFAELT